jgi:hypothetical protein
MTIFYTQQQKKAQAIIRLSQVTRCWDAADSNAVA